MDALDLVKREKSKLALQPEWADVCFTCGTCASGCPVTGVDGWDPRKAVRAALLGLEDELVDSRWPWICTICGRCQYMCPQGVQLMALIRYARTLRERDKVPDPIHRGVLMCLERGNNLGIPEFDFLFLLADLSKEMEEGSVESHREHGVNYPPYPGFYCPVDKEGAEIIITINSKEPFGEPEDMMFWWRILYNAKENWTVPKENWEGVNWGLFSGDDDALKEQCGRVIANAKKVGAKTILYPE
jgi:heterodisulfide reductase subunit C